MFSKKYLIPLIITLAAVTIGGSALAYNNFKPKNEVAKLTTTSLSSSSPVSKSESSSTISKSSQVSVSSTSSTISQNSSSANSSQSEIKKVPVEVEKSEQVAINQAKGSPEINSQPLTKVTKNIPSENCTLPDLAGYDVLQTQKGCLYFKQNFEGNNYAWEWSPEFVAKDRLKLTKALQDIAAIQHDKYYDQLVFKNASMEIRGYVNSDNGQRSIALGFHDQQYRNFAGDWFDYAEYFNLYEDRNGNWSFEGYDPNALRGCTLKPIETTQIIQTRFRCLEFPIDMYNDPKFDWISSFNPRDKPVLQQAIINATVEFYEANYPRSLSQFPTITIEKYSNNQIYFELSDTPVDIISRSGKTSKIYEFYQDNYGSWSYGEEAKIAKLKQKQTKCNSSSNDYITIVQVKDDCISFAERYTCDPSGNQINKNLRSLILNEVANLYNEFSSNIPSEQYWTGMVCESPKEPSFDFSLDIGYSDTNTKFKVNYIAKYENNIWKIIRMDTIKN
jgi:hypothetical protein